MFDILKKVNDSNPLLIKVYDRKDAAIRLLREDPTVKTIAIREDDIAVRFHGGHDAEAALLRRLVESGIPVNGFIREQGDLESIFMQITNHDEGKVVLSSEE